MSHRLIKYIQRVLPYLALAGGALNLLFWVLYFSKIIVLGKEDEALVRGFESAFPFADALMGMGLLLAGIGLIKRRPFGVFFLVVAASMALYLGILDVTFYGRQGMYLPLTPSSLFELFINVICIGGGAFGLWFGWKLWRES